jgi:hypothetical protein
MTNGATLLTVTNIDTGLTETVDGRAIRHLFCDDDNGDMVVLIDGSGHEYTADSAAWATVAHVSRFH